jgi:hypothetical protein
MRWNRKRFGRGFLADASGLVAAGLLLFGAQGHEAYACEPLHELIFIGPPDAQPAPPPQAQLCWASECRSIGGSDKGQFGDLKKDHFGQLEAIVQVITNQTTGKVVTLVEEISSDVDCGHLIPPSDPAVECSTLFKVKGIRPIGEPAESPLCTFDDLDDLDTITRNPQSEHVVVVDANGKQCEARTKGLYNLFYQDCCWPADLFGQPGDQIATRTSLVIDNEGVCSDNPVRTDGNQGVEEFPAEEAESCL